MPAHNADLALPDFSPVPRICKRNDGWTPRRQRDFIEALARTGSVTSAARAVNMAHASAYALRQHPEAESFRVAWDAALALGVQRLADIAMERAIEGVAVPVFWRGEQVGERREYSNWLLMCLLRHHAPDRYATFGLGAHAVPRKIRDSEAAEHCPVCKARAAAEAQAAADAPGEGARQAEMNGQLLALYATKVESERRCRVAGEVIAADFYLRQLTHLEVMLDGAGIGGELMDRWTTRPAQWGGLMAIDVSEISAFLARTREAFWAHIGAPVRPTLRVDAKQNEMEGFVRGPTSDVREAAQRAAQARIALAQAEWEAAANEETWAAWRERSAAA